MNEPSNFLDGQIDGCQKSGSDGSLDNPPYVPRSIQGGTLYYHVSQKSILFFKFNFLNILKFIRNEGLQILYRSFNLPVKGSVLKG